MRVLIPFLHLQELFRCTAYTKESSATWIALTCHQVPEKTGASRLTPGGISSQNVWCATPQSAECRQHSHALPHTFSCHSLSKNTFSLVFELRWFKIVYYQHLGDVISHRQSWSWVIQVDGHARLLRMGMEEAGRSSQLGQAEVPAFESFISLLLGDWHHAPDSARLDMSQQGCCIQTESPAAHPSGGLGKRDPMTHHDTWHTSLHMVIGSLIYYPFIYDSVPDRQHQ